MSGKARSEPALLRLAEACGISGGYRDGMGVERFASPETLRALLGALGLSAATEAEAAERLAEMEGPAEALAMPPSVALRGGGPSSVPLRADAADESAIVAWRLELESGKRLEGKSRWGDLAPDRETPGRRLLTMSGPVPPGYHRLVVSSGDQGDCEAQSHVIAAPETCYLPDDPGRCWGLGAQLYSLVSGTNWGMGDYGDLARLAGTAAREGADFLGLSPVHALFSGDPGHFGPYGPSNRAFFNTAHIDPTAVPGFEDCEAVRRYVAENGRAIEAARAGALVDYAAVDRVKRPALDLLWRHFTGNRMETDAGARFRSYREDRGHALESHALFEALHVEFFARGEWDWRNWPDVYRDPHSPEMAAFAEANAERRAFFTWLQWLAEEQLAAAQTAASNGGMRIGLYTDLAVGLDPGGSEAWSHQHLIPSGISVGAPPDAFNLLGQNWGVAPLSPRRLAERGFDVFANAMRANMRHSGATRIDHAMQLTRLFWIPPGGAGVDGAYVRYPLEEMLAVVALESHRQQCLVIGEDLGAVPDGFRDRLAQEHILTYKLFYFERGKDGGFIPPETYPRDALVAATTHDLPTSCGLIEGRDLEWRERLELFPDDESRKAARADRSDSLARLTAALRAAGLIGRLPPLEEELIAALHAYLAGAPSRLLAIQAEDLVGAREQPNLPGTTDEHPNWRRRLPVAIDELFQSAPAAAILNAVRARRGRS